MARTIFVTGTDTSVGKTALTALLLAHAQAAGLKVRALKPFATGGGGDEALLASLQDDSLSINFFHFPEPIAPWSASKIHNRPILLETALRPILKHRTEGDLLLIEGAGGLLSPLGHHFTAADLISELDAEVIVVAANKLGVLNHTLLTIFALRSRAIAPIRIALVEQAGADLSRKSNFADLSELLPDIPITPIPFLENYQADADFIRSAAKELSPELSRLLTEEHQGKKNPPDTEAEGTFP